MISRRRFLLCSLGAVEISKKIAANRPQAITVKGVVNIDELGFTLTHEHVLVDFVGANLISRDRYNADEVFNVALPKLIELRNAGFKSLVECTPAFLGRDVRLLQKLSKASGLHIITNTGFYGAMGEKYIPNDIKQLPAESIAEIWINEFRHGIDDSGIKPGFIKIGVDSAPFSFVVHNIVSAAAITHLATGLTIGVHTANGEAAREQLRILKEHLVHPSAWIWIHAQNEADISFHIEAASLGGWVSFDGINETSLDRHLTFLAQMKKHHLLHRVLLSQDAGWYHVGEPGGGNFQGYTFIHHKFLPALVNSGFRNDEVNMLFVRNPAAALCVRVRKV